MGLHLNRIKLKSLLKKVGFLKAFEVLVDLVRDAAVFAVDEDRNIILWSKGAEELLGFKGEEVIGQSCLKANRCVSCIQGCGLKEGGSEGITLELYRADGQTICVKKYSHPFFDEEGNFIGGIEVLFPAEETSPSDCPWKFNGSDEIISFHGLISRSPLIKRAIEIVKNVAKSDVTVLIRGESGTGKELIARAIHQESLRKDGPFIAVNCAAFTPSLLESELFGHVKGAFTGATANRKGVFALAHRGTLFLDEVAEMPLELQAKLLRVLQEKKFTPVGGTSTITVDVRIISATNKSLRRLVREGKFREDLMFRLRVVPIFLPPLRERREDIELLLWHFIEERNKHSTRKVRRISPEAMRALLNYHWPGNVRELQNVVDYAFAVGRGSSIELADLPPEFREHLSSDSHTALPPIVEPVKSASTVKYGDKNLPLLPLGGDEKTRILAALEYTNGHLGRAAELLGMSRTTLWRKRKQYGI